VKAPETGIFLPSGTVKYHGGPFTRNSERYLKGGFGNGASLSIGALLGEPGGGGSFAEGPEGYKRKAVGMGISLNGGSVGQPGVDLSTRDCEIWLKGALKVECLSLCGSFVKGTWRGLPCWGP